MPLSLAILMSATPVARRGTVLGAWAAGGALAAALSWHWIFWLNVPVGLALIPLVWGVIAGQGAAIADRPFATASAVSVLAYGGLFVLDQSLGPDPLRAATHLLPMTAAMALGAPAAGALTDRIGAPPLMLTALLTCAVALTLLAAGNPRPPSCCSSAPAPPACSPPSSAR